MKRCKSFTLLLGFIATINFASVISTYAQTATGNVEGFVVGESGPYVNAKVSALCYTDPPFGAIVYTNEEGYFSISGLPVGVAVSVVAYDEDSYKQPKVISMGSGTIRFEGQTIALEMNPVPRITQSE